MHFKDLDIDIIAPLMQPTVKAHQIFWLRECSSFYRLRCQYYSFFGVSSYCQKEEYYLYRNHFQVSLQDQLLLLSSKECFFHWSNSDSRERNDMLQCLSTDAEQIQFVLKIVFEFMIMQISQRVRHRGPSNKF